MVDNLDELEGWTKIQIPHDKRKYPNPRVHESFIGLRHYAGEVRQVIVREMGVRSPPFLLPTISTCLWICLLETTPGDGALKTASRRQ